MCGTQIHSLWFIVGIRRSIDKMQLNEMNTVIELLWLRRVFNEWIVNGGPSKCRMGRSHTVCHEIFDLRLISADQPCWPIGLPKQTASNRG